MYFLDIRYSYCLSVCLMCEYIYLRAQIYTHARTLKRRRTHRTKKLAINFSIFLHLQPVITTGLGMDALRSNTFSFSHAHTFSLYFIRTFCFTSLFFLFFFYFLFSPPPLPTLFFITVPPSHP